MLRTAILFAVPVVCIAADEEAPATALIQRACLTCHSTAARMGGLVLESREAAVKGGKSGAALVPGDAKGSPLVRLVQEGKMPAGNPLPAADRELLSRWVNAGAPWTKTLSATERKRADRNWWSLQPVQKADPPAAGSGSAIDRFLLAAMTAKGLRPSPPAEKRVLIRRVTFDMTGLPPAPEEIDAFVNDSRPDAYEKLVDRLLASPAYGERWGRHWMDVIRFGESNGYEQNHLRTNAWPFRDYIIQSFNEDKPYDRLVTEHLAGDVVGKGDPAVEVGTGFLVAGPHDTVGNSAEAAKRQQRADDLDDMINATASTFLGLTVNCARCHDHKFDPIQQMDYYRMASLLNGASFGERRLATDEEERRFKDVVAPLEEEQKALVEELDGLKKGAAERVKEQREKLLSAHRPAADARLTEETFSPRQARFVRLRIEATSNGGAGALDEIEVWDGNKNVALGAKATASSTRKADDDPNAYSARHLTDGKFGQRWIGDSQTATLEIDLGAEQVVSKMSWSRDRDGGFQGRFEGPVPETYTVEVSSNGRDWERVASSEGRLPSRPDRLERFLMLAAMDAPDRTKWIEIEDRQKAVRQKIADLPKVPKAYIGMFQQPTEPVYLLKRGNVMDRGDEVTPTSLSVLSHGTFNVELTAPEGQRRLALAAWITDRNNPLTARVMANRVWHYHFGHGIVDTPSDFGFNGGRPTHPELLDYLATRLMDYGWRLKPLHKEILMSAAYRQSSAHVEANAKIDNDTRYLWRYPPRRLEAEAIRDSILAVSGKLDPKMGGPGFHLFRYTVDNVATYYPAENFGPETFRRSVYQTAARSVRSEMLGQYDCPDSSLPEPRRIVTTTPLQALALLNNRFVLDQSRYFAERLEKESPSREAQVVRAFQLSFGRPPETGELAAALRFVEEQGLAALCRALLNANEFVYVM